MSLSRNSRAISFALLQEITEAVRERIESSGESADNFEVEIHPRSNEIRVFLLRIRPDGEVDIFWSFERKHGHDI